MKLFTIGFALAAIVATPVIATEQGNSFNSPGHQMQRHGSVPGHPGASGYAPGHNKDTFHHRRETTGFGGRDRDFDRDDFRRSHRDFDRDGFRRHHDFDRDDFQRGDRDFDRDDMRRDRY